MNDQTSEGLVNNTLDNAGLTGRLGYGHIHTLS